MMTKHDEIKETLQLLESKGFELCEVDVGEDDVVMAFNLNNALEAIMSTNVTTLFLTKEGRNYWIDFQIESQLGDSIGDYSLNTSFDEVVEEIGQKYH